MLLAAGLGTRLRPVTDHYAKPAVPFLNVPLIFWSLEFLRELAPDRVVANVHYKPETIQALSPTMKKNDFNVSFSHEVEKPLGSGGALWFAQSQLEDSETIVVTNADEVIFPVHPKTLTRMREAHEKSGALATLLTMDHEEAGKKFGGVWVDDQNVIQGFGFDRSAFPKAKKALHYVGVLFLNRRIFKYLPEGESNILYDGVRAGIAAGETVQAFREELGWYETGNPKDFLIATEALLASLSPRSQSTLMTDLVRSVVARYSHPQTHVWESESGSRLLASAYANGSIAESEICRELEKGKAFAVIGPNALIRSVPVNSVVMPSAETSKTASIRDAIILP